MRNLIITIILVSFSTGVFALDVNTTQAVQKAVSSTQSVDKNELKTGKRYHGTCHILNDKGQSIERADCSESHVTCKSGWGTQCTIGDKQGVRRNDKIERAERLHDKVKVK